MKFKLIPKTDLEALYALRKSELHGRYSFKQVKKEYYKNKYFYIGCYLGDKLIGAAYGFIKKFWFKENVVILDGLAVKKEYRSHGIGPKLLSIFEKHAKNTGLHKLIVLAATSPHWVVNFYKKYKYVIEKPYDDNCIIMSKNI